MKNVAVDLLATFYFKFLVLEYLSCGQHTSRVHGEHFMYVIYILLWETRE